MNPKNISVTFILKNGNIKKFDCDDVIFIKDLIYIITKNGEKRYTLINDFKFCTIDIEGNA